MNRWLGVIAVISFLISCKSSKLVPGVPTLKNPKEVVAYMDAQPSQDSLLHIKATGKYVFGKDKQNFRADIRIIKDSLIWIELSEALLGIKAARGVIYKDSVAFINKIERSYIAGSMEYFNKKYETEVDFYMLQNLLLAKPIRKLDTQEEMKLVLLEKVYQLYYLPELDPLFKFTQPNFYFEIDPTDFHINKQEAVDGQYKVSASYDQFSQVGDTNYPSKLLLDLIFETPIKLELQYKEILAKQELRVPFSISSKYTKVE